MQTLLASGDGVGIRHRSPMVALVVAMLAVATVADVGHSATNATPARGGYVAGPYPTGPYTFVNDAVGAGIFYDSGFLGGSTVIGNIEAGFIWDRHEVFDRSGLGLGPTVEQQVAGTGVAGQYDFHATMVGHVLAGTGYVAATGSTSAGYSYVGTGLAPLATLWSGAIATSFSSTTIGSFDTTPASTIPVFRQFFQGISGTACDVVNSSYGGADPAAIEPESLAIDALAWQNPTVTFVASAGNDGPDAVVAPGADFNGITVGSVGGAAFRTPSDFTSRGRIDFYNPATGDTLVGVRSGVDVAAPGENDFLAAYLGPTGGLGPFPQYTQNPSPIDRYFVNMDGTSFASPTVAGGIALMKDAAKGLSFVPATALDSRVVKAVLMATSAATDGWSNGQASVGGVIRTTQAVDEATGAGAIDLRSAGLTYVNGGTLDVSGSAGGSIGLDGWDFGAIDVGGHVDYPFSTSSLAGDQIQVALDWFANGVFDSASDTGTRTAFANLDLQVWNVVSGSFSTLVAESAAIYDNVEFLRFMLPAAGNYGLRVTLPGMIYDVGVTPVTTEAYGLSWNLIAVPEPSAVSSLVAGVGTAVLVGLGRRRITPPATRG
ncbi:MAG: S8 family serine peptidase [Pirellulales bacterium]